jgi:hypothetical protein
MEVSYINIKKLNTEQLLELYSRLLDELKQRNIIRSNNLVGEIGEYFAINCYTKQKGRPNLQAAPTGTKKC